MSNEQSNLPKVKTNDLAVSQPPIISSFADFAEKELTASIIVKAGCKLCHSKHRKEAEERYARTGNALGVHRYLTDQGEEISYVAVHRHLQKHYENPDREQRLKEYAQDIKSWSKIQQEKTERFKEHITILERKIRLLDSATNDDDQEAQRKTADAIVKLIEQIGKIEERIEKEKVEESPVRILLFKFEEMVKGKLESISSAEAKIALVDILESFASVVEEFEKNAGS